MGMKGPGGNEDRQVVLEFNLNDAQRQRLMEMGQNAVLDYFRNQNVPVFIEGPRPDADPENDANERNNPRL